MTSTAVSESPAAHMEGSEFTARIRAGDRDALQAVVQAYLGQILRAARAVGLSPQLAEDVTQATFATFLEVASRFEGRSHVRTFLFGILYRKIADARRELKRDRQMDAIEDTIEKRFRTDGSWQRPPRPVDLKLRRRGQVVVVNVPFTGHAGFKPRPALIVSVEAFHRNLLDVVVCPVSSQPRFFEQPGPGDHPLKHWKTVGLHHPSTARISNILAVDKKLIKRVLGKLHKQDLAAVAQGLQDTFGLQR